PAGGGPPPVRGLGGLRLALPPARGPPALEQVPLRRLPAQPGRPPAVRAAADPRGHLLQGPADGPRPPPRPSGRALPAVRRDDGKDRPPGPADLRGPDRLPPAGGA